MELPHIPQDDLLDVMEMTQKLEKYISRTLAENSRELAMGALMSATINCILGQCHTLDEVVFHRNVFMKIFDDSIRSIKIKQQD